MRPPPPPVVIGINAGVADGRDPSWLWDVPYERLQGRFVVALGERRHDLAEQPRTFEEAEAERAQADTWVKYESKKATGPTDVTEDNGFAALGVDARLVERLARDGIAAPFPIQTATIPDALAGHDVLVARDQISRQVGQFFTQFDALLTGDPESAVTLPLRPPEVELLKVAHHGSSDEGLDDLLSLAHPQIALISVGKGNDYGHPRSPLSPRSPD